MVIQKYLYHYTNFYSGLSILKSRSLRLYNALRQKDDFEIIYTGNYAFDYIIEYLRVNSNKLTQDKGSALIYSLMPLAEYYADKKRKEIVKLSVERTKHLTIFDSYYNDLKKRDLKFFIASFSDSNQNNYLWNNYANYGRGLVIEFKTEQLPISTSIKEINYLDSFRNKQVNDFLLEHLFSKNSDLISFISQFFENITHFCLSNKRREFQHEREFRLIEFYDSLVDKHNKIILNESGREFINLPMSEDQFINNVKNIYYSNRIANSDYYQLKKIAENFSVKLECLNLE